MRTTSVILGLLAASALGLASAPSAATPTPPPFYEPPAADGKTDLDHLVAWKTKWLEWRIKDRKSEMAAKKNALREDPSRADELNPEIEKLKKEAEKAEDEKNNLNGKGAFDPKVPGSPANAKVLKANVKEAVRYFEEEAAKEQKIESSPDYSPDSHKRAKRDREKDQDTVNKLRKDLGAVEKESPEVFKD